MSMQVVTGLIGLAAMFIFMGFMLVWVKALPLIIIVLGVCLLLIYDFVQTMRHGEGWSSR